MGKVTSYVPFLAVTVAEVAKYWAAADVELVSVLFTKVAGTVYSPSASVLLACALVAGLIPNSAKSVTTTASKPT